MESVTWQHDVRTTLGGPAPPLRRGWTPLVRTVLYVYTLIRQTVRYEWDPAKRARNIAKHGLDFADSWDVYEHAAKADVASRHAGAEGRQGQPPRAGGVP